MEVVDKIMQFQVVCNGDEKLFIYKLSKENKWSIAFSEQAFFEYKRFIYLASLGRTRVVPSKIIDKVWHLHLSFTKSYWIEMCENILQKEIHHNPSLLTTDSKTRDLEDFRNTIDLYRQVYNAIPPVACWQIKERDRSSNWLLIPIFSMLILTACTPEVDSETLTYLKWGVGIYTVYKIFKWLGFGNGSGGECGGCNSCSSCGGD